MTKSAQDIIDEVVREDRARDPNNKKSAQDIIDEVVFEETWRSRYRPMSGCVR